MTHQPELPIPRGEFCVEAPASSGYAPRKGDWVMVRCPEDARSAGISLPNKAFKAYVESVSTENRMMVDVTCITLDQYDWEKGIANFKVEGLLAHHPDHGDRGWRHDADCDSKLWTPLKSRWVKREEEE